MRRAVRTMLSTTIAGLFFLLPATPVLAQEHVVSTETLDQLAVEHAASASAERAELREFLARPDVRDVAATAGVSLVAATDAVAVLDVADVSRLVEQARQVDAALAGGDTLVISTTAIIIALLILIIILVA